MFEVFRVFSKKCTYPQKRYRISGGGGGMGLRMRTSPQPITVGNALSIMSFCFIILLKSWLFCVFQTILNLTYCVKCMSHDFIDTTQGKFIKN